MFYFFIDASLFCYIYKVYINAVFLKFRQLKVIIRHRFLKKKIRRFNKLSKLHSFKFFKIYRLVLRKARLVLVSMKAFLCFRSSFIVNLSVYYGHSVYLACLKPFFLTGVIALKLKKKFLYKRVRLGGMRTMCIHFNDSAHSVILRRIKSAVSKKRFILANKIKG